jgi:hypothetical protein
VERLVISLEIVVKVVGAEVVETVMVAVEVVADVSKDVVAVDQDQNQDRFIIKIK